MPVSDAFAVEFKARDPFAAAVKRLDASLFEKQRAVTTDKSSPYRVLCCSRRAGKTQLIARYLLMRALQVPNSEVLYLATTGKSAREIVWDGPSGLPNIVKHLGLDAFCTLNETKTAIKFANGTILHVSGAESKVDAARWQGHAYALVVIDEAQDFPEEILRYLTREVIGPALLDFGGELLMAGVPKPLCAGMFYEAAEGKQAAWSRHGWTVFDNEKLPAGHAQKWVDEELARFGEKENDPGPQRRYWGRWVREDSSQLYSYLPGRNDYEGELPEIDERHRHVVWQHVLGMDIGHRDLTTFTLMSWSTQVPTMYVQEAYGKAKLIDDGIAAIIRNFQLRYAQPQLVADCGALALMIVEGLKARYHLAIEPALKQEKAGAIRLLNTALRKGQVLFRKDGCPELLQQLQQLEMDPRTQIERPQDPCDYADSMLYAFRHCYSYIYKPAPPKPTTDELMREREREAWERTLKQYPEDGPQAQIEREMAEWEPPAELDF